MTDDLKVNDFHVLILEREEDEGGVPNEGSLDGCIIVALPGG